MRKMKPRRIQIDPTTRYAMPRKGFLPPSHDVVVRIILFAPLNVRVGYAVDEKTYAFTVPVITHTELTLCCR